MLKPLAIGILFMASASAAPVFAGNQQEQVHTAPWNLTYSDDWNSSDSDWSTVVGDTQLPKYIRDWCSSNHAQCDQYEDWAESTGFWKDDDKGSPMPAPEVDPAGAMGALTILVAALAIARGRRPLRNQA